MKIKLHKINKYRNSNYNTFKNKLIMPTLRFAMHYPALLYSSVFLIFLECLSANLCTTGLPVYSILICRSFWDSDFSCLGQVMLSTPLDERLDCTWSMLHCSGIKYLRTKCRETDPWSSVFSSCFPARRQHNMKLIMFIIIIISIRYLISDIISHTNFICCIR